MRRFLILLFAIVLPFQFAWAGAAAYCGHESGGNGGRAGIVVDSGMHAVKWHFGHHAHEHAPADGHADKTKTGVKLPDVDCAVCHFAGSTGVFSAAMVPTSHQLATLRYLPRAAAFGSVPAPVPDRPQWSSPA